jgi:hypothetical protein
VARVSILSGFLDEIKEGLLYDAGPLLRGFVSEPTSPVTP